MNFVKISFQDQVCAITMSRPNVRNAFHPQMIGELKQAFDSVQQNDQIRAVVLQGEGRSFCAGADLEWMKAMASFTHQQNLEDAGALYAMFESIWHCRKPVIGMVQGHVFGGGLGLAAVCDFVLSEAQTKFCFSEVRLGLVPAVISSFVMAAMQPKRAQQAMLTGQIFHARQACEWGLVSFVGSLSECEEEKTRLLQLLGENGPQALAATKKLCHLIQSSTDSEAIKTNSIQVIAERRVSAEGQEGIRSFLEERKPYWHKAGPK